MKLRLNPLSNRQAVNFSSYLEEVFEMLKENYPELTDDEILNEMHIALFSDYYRQTTIRYCKYLIEQKKVEGDKSPPPSGQA